MTNMSFIEWLVYLILFELTFQVQFSVPIIQFDHKHDATADVQILAKWVLKMACPKSAENAFHTVKSQAKAIAL